MVIFVRKYCLFIAPSKKSLLAYMEFARFASMFTTDKMSELCLLLTLFLLRVILAEGVPLCVSAAGSLSRAVVCYVQYTAQCCVLHITHNSPCSHSSASSKSIGPGRCPGRLQGRNPAKSLYRTGVNIEIPTTPKTKWVTTDLY